MEICIWEVILGGDLEERFVGCGDWYRMRWCCGELLGGLAKEKEMYGIELVVEERIRFRMDLIWLLEKITVWQGYFAGGKLHFAGGKLYFAGGKLYFAGGKLYFAGGNHTLRVATYIAGGNRTLRVATILCGWQPYFAGGNRTLRIETL